MNISRVAYRYAEAILDALPEGLGQEAFFNDLLDLQHSVEQSRELQLFFESPVLSQAQKLDAVEALFTGRMQGYVLDVLKMLVDKRREDLILQIIEALKEIRRDRNNIRLSAVSTAVELDDAQKLSLQSMLEQASKATIETSWRVDPSLKGGVVVRIQDTVFDGSVSHQLRKLRKRFASGT